MPRKGRYETTGLAEDQYEHGSRGRVLKNLLGINRKREMDERETIELLRAQETVLSMYSRSHRFTVADIFEMHRIWLSPIYEWAGRERQVNISKGEFSFPPSRFLTSSLNDFEQNVLARYTPCNFRSMDEIVHALAVVHAELLFIHPFREGNGRIARMLATLMALQAGLPPLDFRGIKGKQKLEYIAAVKAGAVKNYQPMEEVFRKVISLSLRLAGKNGR